jgi:hypothetical protein
VNPDDYKIHNIEPGRVRQINRSQHQQLAFFGDATEIVGGDPDEHPFQQYLRKLRELHGGVSWMGDREFMEVMLMGYAEGWSQAELQQRLTRTNWYQSRTAAERVWEIDTSQADRRSSVKKWEQRMVEGIEALYGEGFTLQEAGVDPKKLRNMAERIASGRWGDPNEGYELWLAQQRDKVERIEGTQAWIERQQEMEERRAFLNRPEEMFERLRQDAMEWLGPAALPDRSVLRGWSERLVSQKASEADWMQFLRQQANALYPFLGPNETWTDRASAYRRIAEETWGTPITWKDPVLQHIGQVGPDGKPTGRAMPYDEFTRYVRQQPKFWRGEVARDEGFQLYNYLDSTFRGVSA